MLDLHDLILAALEEDVGAGDVTADATIEPARVATASILLKSAGVVAGLAVAREVFAAVSSDVQFDPTVKDGQFLAPGTVIASLRGPARALLTAERTALNFLQRMSGIATLTRRFVDAVAGTRAVILDTRKTAPLLRPFDRLAVRAGGGTNHRRGLDDMILIKDNHVAAAGGVRQAIERAIEWNTHREHSLPVEVEVRSLGELREALSANGLTRIMLDNFSVETIREAVALVGGRVPLEASGGITLDTVRAVALCGVDFISVGALTHSAIAIDISMEISV
jgi:nicotinate-nucleotide pyrophosphorylase (carboxylating)